jgi:hypothetical protein
MDDELEKHLRDSEFIFLDEEQCLEEDANCEKPSTSESFYRHYKKEEPDEKAIYFTEESVDFEDFETSFLRTKSKKEQVEVCKTTF